MANTPIRTESIDTSPPPLQAASQGLIPFSEVEKHNTPDDLWVVIDGKVYDLTEVRLLSARSFRLSTSYLTANVQFAHSGHPGGSAPIHRVAGKDATAIFQPLHPPGTIENGLEHEACLGAVDPQTLPAVLSTTSSAPRASDREVDLAEIIGLPDFDAAAQTKLTGKAWAYMKSGATDECSRSSCSSYVGTEG